MPTNKIVEDAVVTTTNNGGEVLDSPKLPIKPKNILTRYKDMVKKKNQKRERSDSDFL